jgi:hypothetical protein
MSAPASPVASTTVQPAARSGGSRFAPWLLVLGAVIAAVAVWYLYTTVQHTGGVGATAPTPTPFVPAAAAPSADTTQETFSEPPAGDGLNLTASLGEKVPIQTSSNEALGTVAVIKSKKYSSHDYQTPNKGNVYLGVYVRYDATSGFDYNALDWVAHDSAGAQFEWEGVDLTPELGSGTLAAGRHKEGWISFQVPKAAAHMWVDYQNSDGSVVFTVKLY